MADLDERFLSPDGVRRFVEWARQLPDPPAIEADDDDDVPTLPGFGIAARVEALPMPVHIAPPPPPPPAPPARPLVPVVAATTNPERIPRCRVTATSCKAWRLCAATGCLREREREA